MFLLSIFFKKYLNSFSKFTPEITEIFFRRWKTAVTTVFILFSNIYLYSSWLWLLYFIETLSHNMLNGFIDVLTCPSACLKILDFESFREIFCFFLFDCSFFLQIYLVTDENWRTILIRLLFDLMYPVLLYSCIFYLRYFRNYFYL